MYLCMYVCMYVLLTLKSMKKKSLGRTELKNEVFKFALENVPLVYPLAQRGIY